MMLILLFFPKLLWNQDAPLKQREEPAHCPSLYSPFPAFLFRNVHGAALGLPAATYAARITAFRKFCQHHAILPWSRLWKHWKTADPGDKSLYLFLSAYRWTQVRRREEPQVSAAPAVWVAQTDWHPERCFLQRLTEFAGTRAGGALALFVPVPGKKGTGTWTLPAVFTN